MGSAELISDDLRHELAIEALREREWPRSTRLSVTTMGVILVTGKTWRSAKKLYDRPADLWRASEHDPLATV